MREVLRIHLLEKKKADLRTMYSFSRVLRKQFSSGNCIDFHMTYKVIERLLVFERLKRCYPIISDRGYDLLAWSGNLAYQVCPLRV